MKRSLASSLLAAVLLAGKAKEMSRRVSLIWTTIHSDKLLFVVLTALLVGLPFAAPVDAAPILISGEYTLHIEGFVVGYPGYPRYDQTVTQSLVGDLSDSLSDAADFIHPELFSPEHFESAASLSFSMLDNQIEAVGMASASTTEWFAPTYAWVDVEFSFSLTEAHFVEAHGFADGRAGTCAFGACSYLMFDGLPPYPGGPWGSWHHNVFSGILEPGTYTISGRADAGAGGPGFPTGNSAQFSFAMGASPIPEPTSALVFGIGALIVGAATRRRALPSV